MEMEVGEEEFVRFNNYKHDKFKMETVVETREFPEYRRYSITFKVRNVGLELVFLAGLMLGLAKVTELLQEISGSIVWRCPYWPCMLYCWWYLALF